MSADGKEATLRGPRYAELNLGIQANEAIRALADQYSVAGILRRNFNEQFRIALPQDTLQAIGKRIAAAFDSSQIWKPIIEQYSRGIVDMGMAQITQNIERTRAGLLAPVREALESAARIGGFTLPSDTFEQFAETASYALNAIDISTAIGGSGLDAQTLITDKLREEEFLELDEAGAVRRRRRLTSREWDTVKVGVKSFVITDGVLVTNAKALLDLPEYAIGTVAGSALLSIIAALFVMYGYWVYVESDEGPGRD